MPYEPSSDSNALRPVAVSEIVITFDKPSEATLGRNPGLIFFPVTCQEMVMSSALTPLASNNAARVTVTDMRFIEIFLRCCDLVVSTWSRRGGPTGPPRRAAYQDRALPLQLPSF